MLCEEAQRLNLVFIEKNMDYKKLNEYVRHISSCNECREELDIVYIVNKGLDGDGSDSFNFQGLLSRNIEEAKLYIKLCQRKRRIMIGLGALSYSFLAVALVSFFMSI